MGRLHVECSVMFSRVAALVACVCSGSDSFQQLNQFFGCGPAKTLQQSCILSFDLSPDLQHPLPSQRRGKDIDLTMIVPGNLTMHKPV